MEKYAIKQYEISKQQSYIIKGIAILLMLFHHFFTFPQWVVDETIDYSCLSVLSSPSKLCVCIFAFINGWTFAFRDVSWKDAGYKIKKLLINYWCIAVPAIFVGFIVCNQKITPVLILKELFGFSNAIMVFAWYIPFYCISILVMTSIQRIIGRNALSGIAVGVIIPILVFSLLKKFSMTPEIQTMFNNLKHWFPCVSVGFMSNKYNLLGKLERMTEKVDKVILSFIFIIGCFAGRYYASGLDFVYCVLMVFAIMSLKIKDNSIIGKILQMCGKNSSNMWFLHCLFFGEFTRTFFQPFAYFARMPVLVYLVALIELLLMSELIEKIKSKILPGGEILRNASKNQE